MDIKTETPGIGYAGMSLSRCSNERKDPQWLEAQLARSDSVFYCLHRDRNLFDVASGLPVPYTLVREQAHPLIELARKPIFLGTQHARPHFAIDLSLGDETRIQLPHNSEFIDLRSVAVQLEDSDASLLAYARGLIYWHAHNQFCGNCGADTYGTQGGHARRCSNADCAREIFPRTDPAVIMLVEDLSDPNNPRCLLGRNKRFAKRMFSTLAGFVDPGETLEGTVIREVFEEVGVHVNNVRYQASQPWPFPSSIMLGFRSTATTHDIDTDADEIEEAYWFSAKELCQFGEWGDGGENNCLPRRDSIARFLIDSWIDDVLKER